MTIQDLKFPRVKWKYLAKENLMYGANESAELDDPSLPRYIRITDLDIEGNLKEETFKSLEWEKAKPYLLQKGDVLLARSGATVGKAYIHEANISACFAGYLIKLKVDHNKVYPKFLYYYTQTKEYADWISENTIQATIQNVSAEKYANLEMPLPGLVEQQVIVSFLNEKTKNISEIVKQKERLIAILEEKRQSMITEAVTKGLNPDVKMKDSGVEWIGEIPEHWNIKKMKYLTQNKLMYGANESAELDDRTLPRYIRITDIDQQGKLKDNTFKSLPKEVADQYPVIGGDILFARSGATVGKSYYHSSEEIASFAGYLIRLRARKEYNSKYLYYYTQSSIYKEWIQSILIQATIQNVSAEKYANLEIPIPPLGEMNQIVDHIEEIETNIYTVISLVTEQIQKLKDYRQSLIYEVVTGKIDVLDFEVKA
ncbi:restriction endonuclease subunit S [Bacillus wiedmannii]|uniref:restriction endonuclease subunit S n=1 Tax=Bacillus wiedmannii TaxID=1890302 RepID=UPI00077B06C5|nr:restriction endonuclease subunit S [Bacillus wiedmannii]KXY09836.1 hypothetical protein AT260_04675 [Bacillus wiedmannii]